MWILQGVCIHTVQHHSFHPALLQSIADKYENCISKIYAASMWEICVQSQVAIQDMPKIQVTVWHVL